MSMLFKNILQKQYYFLDFITFLLLLLITSFSILEDLTVLAQEDLEILINENGEDTFTDEGNNQQEDKPIKIDTVNSSSSSSSIQNFWNDIIILAIGISVAISLYFLIKHLIKKAADSWALIKDN